MKLSITILILPTLLGTACRASPITTETSGIPGYGIWVPEYSFEVTPGGPNVTLKGTVQEVYAQLLELNPNYEAEFGTLEQNAAAAKNASGIQNRDTPPVKGPYWEGDWNCGYGDEPADIAAIHNGIAYLRGLTGNPTNGAGPGNCGRVSCSYQSAIWWCNDNTTPFRHSSWQPIADGAENILDFCVGVGLHIGGGGEQSLEPFVSGQAFNRNKWNVIVRGDNC